VAAEVELLDAAIERDWVFVRRKLDEFAARLES